MNIFRTSADCTKMSILLIHKLTLLVPDGKMGIFLSFFLSSCNLGTSRLSFRALQLTFLRSQLQSLRFCKEMPFFSPLFYLIFFLFWTRMCLSWGIQWAEFSEDGASVSYALLQCLHWFLGPCFEVLPEDASSNIMQECYFTRVFIHHRPAQTGLFLHPLLLILLWEIH